MKDKLQQELLKKLKPGIKPSGLKKNMEGVLHDFNLPPSDEGYESETDSHQSLVKNPDQDQIKDLKKEVKY